MDWACLPSRLGLPCWCVSVCGSAGLFLKSELGEKQNKAEEQHEEHPYEDESTAHWGHLFFSLSKQEGQSQVKFSIFSVL